MGIFSRTPQQPRADLELESLLKANTSENAGLNEKRTFVAEWFPQSGVQLTWPHAQTDWRDMLDEVTETYLLLAYEIGKREPLIIVSPETKALRQLLEERLPKHVLSNIRIEQIDTNDTWARDHAFLSVFGENEIELHDFKFNAWGNKFEWEKDNAINGQLINSRHIHGTYINHPDFVLEGGSIETDGSGTLLTTSKCLLNPNRNPALSKEIIEQKLKTWFSVDNILWLDYGYIEGDDTDAHIDTLARLCPDNHILYVKCKDASDASHEEMNLMEQQLRSFRNSYEQPYNLVALPQPSPILFDGERLPATYANYLVLNHAILMPTYNQPENDALAARQIAKVFPSYDIVTVPCLSLIKQHGSLHCATMQYPRGVVQL